MSCKFYGTCAVWHMHGLHQHTRKSDEGPAPEFRILVTNGGNQCGLIIESFSPCRMEIAGQEIDFDQCELKGTRRAEEFKDYERREFIKREENRP